MSLETLEEYAKRENNNACGQYAMRKDKVGGVVQKECKEFQR